MSLTQRILDVWATSRHVPPKIPLIFHENEYMITVDDTETFYRFMSTDGQIFLALSRNCQLATPDLSNQAALGKAVYLCNKVDPILCSPTSGPDSIRDIFVLNNIVPLLQ